MLRAAIAIQIDSKLRLAASSGVTVRMNGEPVQGRLKRIWKTGTDSIDELLWRYVRLRRWGG